MEKTVAALRGLLGTVAAICLGSAALPAHAALYDANADWSDVSNPNGVWSYREGSNLLPHVADWTPLGASPAQPAWAPGTAAGDFLPAIFKATSAHEDWLVGDLVIHTTDDANGAGNGVGNLLFTAPSSGTASINGLLWNAREISDRPQAYTLFLNGLPVNTGPLVGVTRSAPVTFSDTLLLNAGDLLELVMYRTGLSEPGTGDFVGFNLSVDFATAVPEPETYAMLVAGLWMLGLVARRRRALANL